MSFQRRMHAMRQEQLRKQSETTMNRWLFIAVMALVTVEIGHRVFM